MSRFANARAVLKQGVADRVFPGAAFGVWDNGTVEFGAVGGFTYDADAPPVDVATLFDIASVTKVMATTAIAMRLWQTGRLRLDLPLCEVLPEFASDDERRQRVTLQMLLAHTSALPAYERLYELPEVLGATTLSAQADAAMSACLTMPLVTVPGEAAVYSDIGFILLGEALRILANADSFNGLFDHEIARPLGLDSSCFLPPATWQSRIAPTCDWNWRHRVLQGEVQDENCAPLGGVAGHAGLFANCADILRFASEMIHPASLFEQRTIDLFSQRILGSRALGWDTPSLPSQSGQYFSARTVGHLGYTGTSLWIDLEQKIAVTLLTNRVYTRPDAPPLPNPSAIQQVRPAFHDALLRDTRGQGKSSDG